MWIEGGLQVDLSWIESELMLGQWNGDKLKLTNIIGYFSLFPFSSIEIRTGLGFTPEFIGDYIKLSALSIPVDVNYYLPMNFAGFKFALNLHAQRTLGYPYKEGVNSTDFLYLGFLIQLYQQPFQLHVPKHSHTCE